MGAFTPAELDSVYEASPDVLVVDVAGTVSLLRVAGGVADLEKDLYAINDSGRLVLERLDGHATLGQLAPGIAQECGAPLPRVERDVTGFVRDLLGRGFVRRVTGEPVQTEPEVVSVPLAGETLAAVLEALAERGVSLRFRATGRSMWPAIRDSDVVTVSPLDSHQPVVGDVVAFRHPETRRLLLHRVVGSTGTALLVRGDNVRAPDGLIPRRQLLGQVTVVERNGRQAGQPLAGHVGLWAAPRLRAYLLLIEVRLAALGIASRVVAGVRALARQPASQQD